MEIFAKNKETQVLIDSEMEPSRFRCYRKPARGIDVPGVGHVINNDVPGDPDTYFHRTGEQLEQEVVILQYPWYQMRDRLIYQNYEECQTKYA